MSSNIIAVTDGSFESDVLKSTTPILVDFWAEWCNPCKMISPILEEVATEYAGKVKIVKMDVDENQETPQKYTVRGIPTLILFKQGEVQATKVGVITKSQLISFLDTHL